MPMAKSAPDGYTLGGATIGHFAINQFLIANMPFVAEKGPCCAVNGL